MRANRWKVRVYKAKKSCSNRLHLRKPPLELVPLAATTTINQQQHDNMSTSTNKVMQTTIFRHVNGYEWVWENLAGNGVAKSFEAARIAGAKALKEVWG